LPPIRITSPELKPSALPSQGAAGLDLEDLLAGGVEVRQRPGDVHLPGLPGRGAEHGDDMLDLGSAD
jgi:hypothetical protein